MSFFGARRARQTRVFRPTPSVWEKLTTSLQDYKVLTLLLIALFAVVTLAIAVQSWCSRFSYREGQIVATGVLARVPFEIENVGATLQAKAEAEDNTRPVFVQNNAVWDKLEASFKSDLTLVANAERLGNLEPAVIDAFGLATEIPGDVEKGTSPTTRFAQVKLALTDSSMAIGDRINRMGLEFSQLLGVARPNGLLSEQDLKNSGLAGEEISTQRPIVVVDKRGEAVSYNLLGDVVLKDQLLETGRLGGMWTSLADLQQIRPAVEAWLTTRVYGQLTYDATTTSNRRREAKETVETQYDSFASGQVLIAAGSMIEKDQLKVLTAEYKAHEASLTYTQRMIRVGGAVLMLSVMVVLFGIYLFRSEPKLLEEVGQLLAFVMICSSAVFLSCTLSQDPWRAEVVPLLAAVMVVAIVHNQMMAILTAFCLSLLISMSTVAELGHFAILMVACITVVIPLRQVSSRSTLIKVGFLLAIVTFVTVWGVSLVSSHDFNDAWRNPVILMTALKFAGWALVCCYLVAGSLPFIETAFGVVTDISLLELTDVSHPLLQELARRAPGTYNHSISVATIGEAAADAIGANGLLLRVGAYFHDIGKGLKPEYFIENMAAGQGNPHDHLAPAMSALIIIGHVKDGVEMAEQHNLPRKLIDFIEQHHGTTLVEYFFREATNRADVDHRTDADESTFRYPGRKPQTKETAVMMLTDAVESASRTLSEPTPKRIQSLVHEIALKRVLDGQFDECGLTMSEIRRVESSLVKSLLAVHHGRIKYPDQKTG